MSKLNKNYYPSVDNCNSIHAVNNWCKVRGIIRAARRGDEIPPILVDAYKDGSMLTGTHRAAAKEILEALGDIIAANKITTVIPKHLNLNSVTKEELDEAITVNDFCRIDEIMDHT